MVDRARKIHIFYEFFLIMCPTIPFSTISSAADPIAGRNTNVVAVVSTMMMFSRVQKGQIAMAAATMLATTAWVARQSSLHTCL